MADNDGDGRTVTVDFVAILLVGLVLSLLLCLNIFFTIWEHEHRSDEHGQIQQHITQLERAERNENPATRGG